MSKLVEKLRTLAANHTRSIDAGYQAIFNEAAQAIEDLESEQQRSRKLGEEIVRLAETVKRILTA